jgi:hypothetical protein
MGLKLNVGWALLGTVLSGLAAWLLGWVGLRVGDVVDAALGSPLGQAGGGWIFPSTGYLMWLLAALGIFAGFVLGAILPSAFRKVPPRVGLAALGALAGAAVGVGLSLPSGSILHLGWAAVPLLAAIGAELQTEPRAPSPPAC